jgi:hypothetical protein
MTPSAVPNINVPLPVAANAGQQLTVNQSGTGIEYNNILKILNNNVDISGNLSINNGNLSINNINRFFFKNIYIETDTSIRSFTTSWADGKVFTLRNYTGNSKLLLHVYVPCRNFSSGWGGGYHNLFYNINNTGYENLGNSGYVSVMNQSGQDVGFWTNVYYLDLNITDNFTCQFKLQHRSYDNTLHINQSTETSGGSANDYNIDQNQNYTKLIILELG